MPLYNSSSAATALGVPLKWLDNLLSHNKIGGVQQARQGVPRRLSIDSMTTIAVVRILADNLQLPLPSAVRLATELLESDNGSLHLGDGLVINLDLKELRRQLNGAIANAIEVTPHRPRGRPPKAQP